jgi:hypothetical protein
MSNVTDEICRLVVLRTRDRCEAQTWWQSAHQLDECVRRQVARRVWWPAVEVVHGARRLIVNTVKRRREPR